MLTKSLIAAACLLWSARATPTGNHTCTGVVKHEVTVRVNVTEPVTFRAYEWCLRVPPRCSTYTIQLKDRVKIHKEMHNRTITVCCKGYVEIDYKCVPACPPKTECPNMHCNRTNHCYCTPGYTGLYCNHPCPKGVWGAGCIKPCDCPPGYTCHHLTGDCMLDDSPPSKTRRTTTAEYLTEAVTSLDTTTRTPATIRTHQTTPTTTTTATERPSTTTTTTTTPRPTTTTTTTLRPTTTTTTTQTPTRTTTTTQRPTTTTTTPTPTTTTTERLTTTPATTTTTMTPTTTESVTQPLTQPTTEQTTTPPLTTTELKTIPTTITTIEPTNTSTTSTLVPITPNIIKITTTTMKPTTSRAIETTPEMALIPIQIITEATTAATTSSTTTQKTTVDISTTTPLPPTPVITTPQDTEEQTTETTNPTTTTTKTTTTTTTTPTTTTTTITPKTEPTTEPKPNTTPSTSTTEPTVQTTQTTTQLPTSTTAGTLPTIHDIQTEPTVYVATPITYGLAPITVEAVTERRESTQPPTTTRVSTTTTQPTIKIEKPQQTEPTTSTTTQKTPLLTDTLPIEEVLKAIPTPISQDKKLEGWGKNQFGFDTKIDTKKSLQSVVKIAMTEQPVTIEKSDLDRRGSEHVLEKFTIHNEGKSRVDEELRSTTDRLDRLIIEDVPKPVPPKPTPEDNPIKLVEEVISKYFPETLLNPIKAHKDTAQGKGELEASDKVITPWVAETKETNKQKTETTEVLRTEEETKSHPRTDITTTTAPSPTTPDISTIPIITPKVIVSAKNPDEIDLGGVIYRKMKFFPPAKQEEPTQAPSTTPSINLHLQTSKEPTTPTGDRFKIYLPEYEKSTEKIDSEITEVPTVKTVLPKFNFDKEDFDYGKQSQPKKAKQKDKEVKKYKVKPNEATVPPTMAEELDNERVTNNVFLETKEFKVHLATTKAAKFGDGYYTKSDQESTDYGKFQKKKPKFGSESEPTRLVKYTVPPESQDFDEGAKESSFPTTNAKPPHTWYSHAREKAKIKNAFKVMKSTIGLDLNPKPTEESALEESNDIHSLATQFTEREPRSAAVTYQEDLNNPQMFGQVKFNAPEGFLSWMADDRMKSGIYASVAVGGGCFVAMAALVAVIWLRLKGRARQGENSASFNVGDERNSPREGQLGPSNAIGDYETVYPLAGESDEMATFFCPTFTNNYAERINREYKEMNYDHPRSSIAEPLYAEILHPKIKDVADARNNSY